MNLARKIRIFPNETQERKLWQSAGTARFIFNWTLARQEENNEQGKPFLSNNELRKEITKLKKTNEFQWLKEVSNNVAKQAVKDACDAYRKWFDSMSGKSKAKQDKPNFKSRHKSKPSFYNDTDKLKVKENQVLIEKVGWVNMKEQLPIDVKYMNPRVSFDGKYWYISVGVEIDAFEVLLTEESKGIDLGVKDLAICSDGKVYKNINKSRKIRKLEKRLHRLECSKARKYEANVKQKVYYQTGSKKGELKSITYHRSLSECGNYQKVKQEIKLIHRRINCIRQNHIHQATAAIVKTKPSRIVMETLNVKGMLKNKHLSKAIAQQKLYEFKRQIGYKSKLYKIEFVQVPMNYPSSKKCSGCGNMKQDLKLSDRTYKCNCCGLEIDRDFNASLNLANYVS
jgi:putative transposase